MFFASDNGSGVPEAVLASLARANAGPTRGYGNDPLTVRVHDRVRAVFEAPQAAVHLVATGTAANALALACLCPPWAAVFAHAYAEARQAAQIPAWWTDQQSPPAPQAELEKMFLHLEEELERGRFFHPPDKAPLMKRHLRAMFLRAHPTDQEVRTMRGVIKALTIGRGGRKKDDS